MAGSTLAITGDGSTAFWSAPAAFARGQAFGVSVQGTFTSGTIRLQKSYDNGNTWVNQDDGSWTAPVETQCDNPAGPVVWRIGCLSGDAFLGTVTVRILQ